MMEDRFKFRLWDKSINEMAYDVCIGFIKDGRNPQDWVCADTTCGQIDYSGNRLNDISLMQCTGLKDKNGNLIYEGDIVDIITEIETTAKIEWSDDLARFTIHFEDVLCDFDNYNSTDLEVLGNICQDKKQYEGCFND